MSFITFSIIVALVLIEANDFESATFD